MQERRTLAFVPEDGLPSSARAVTDNSGSIYGNVLYIPMFREGPFATATGETSFKLPYNGNTIIYNNGSVYIGIAPESETVYATFYRMFSDLKDDMIRIKPIDLTSTHSQKLARIQPNGIFGTAGTDDGFMIFPDMTITQYGGSSKDHISFEGYFRIEFSGRIFIREIYTIGGGSSYYYMIPENECVLLNAYEHPIYLNNE